MPPCNALALRIPLAAGEEPAVQAMEDPDAFDANDQSLYSVADGDDDHMLMIEDMLCPLNDPRCVHEKVQCPRCGLPAPWASKLGCELS